MKINKNFLNFKDNYLFTNIAKKTAEFSKKNPDRKIIKLGIGDVTLPLCSAVVDEMKSAAMDMGKKETFKGYGPEEGYEFARQAVMGYYKNFGVDLSPREIFINDGAKSDLGGILDIFSSDNTVLIPDPVYPAYVDTNIMDGRKIIYMDANENNDFLPLPDESKAVDIIYICSPNNPTGSVYNHDQLKTWVDYAVRNNAVILFDAAYESFIENGSLPRSIFEIDGAKKCAIEICSLSKTAGFTGVRCGYTVIPNDLIFDGQSLNKLWLRRLATKFNGVSYVVQRAMAAVFSHEGQKQVRENISYYKKNAKIIADALTDLGIYFVGGENSPYIWLKCPNGMGSWDFFDYLLEGANVVGTPGAGFGKNGEGFFRLSAFGNRESIVEAVRRIKNLLQK